MMKKGTAILFIAIVSMSLWGCKTKSGGQTSGSSKKDPALLIFTGKDTVYKSDFEYVYQKNNGGWEAVKAHTPAQYREYLDLYVNFKRKVLEAESLGLDQTEAFKSEFEGYRKQLAQPYLVDKEVQEELVNEAYRRSQEFVSASHILIMCGPDALPDDTLKAYNKVLALRDSVLKGGKPFGAVAARHSEDPSAKSNEGSLGYFSVFDMVYPFETGVYGLKVGEVSMPVRSGFGYHLIKLDDRVKNTGIKTVGHIIIRVGPQYSAKDEDQAKAKINEIYEQLRKGAKWEDLCEKYSDDPNTANKGGDLGSGRLIPEMENIKRNLGEGEYSKPFTTAFGHHILRVNKVEVPKTFDEAKAEIKSRIARDARSTISRERLIKRVQQDYSFTRNQDNIDKFVKAIEAQNAVPQYTKGFWKPEDSLHKPFYTLPIYTMGSGSDKHVGTLQDYFEWYVKARKGYDNATAAVATEKFVTAFFEQEMLNFEERQLPKKHREYRELLREYRDGILLFTLTEDKVWRKAVEDTVGLRNYYVSHRDSFMAGERIVVTEYISDKQDAINQAAALLAKGYGEQAVDSMVNATSALNLRVRTQTYEKGKGTQEDAMFGKQPGSRSEVMEAGRSFRILVLKENLPAGIKSFDDAKSECITQYQNYLEKAWLKELEGKYPVKVQEKVFETLYQ